MLLCCGILFVKDKFFEIEKNSFDKILYGIIIVILVCGLILKLKGFTQIEPVRGEFDGYLIFNEDSIQIKDEIIPLQNIRSIQISNGDYNGKLVYTSKGNVGPALSNGTSNSIVIFPESGKTTKHFFQLDDSNDFEELRNTLIKYHLKEKIDIWELANILGAKSDFQFQNLKDDIEKFKHSC